MKTIAFYHIIGSAF